MSDPKKADTKKQDKTPPAPTDSSPLTTRANVRWHLPKFGGIPMPKGYTFYGFLTFDMTRKDGRVPTEKEILAAAVKKGALEDGLTVEGFTVLPEKW